MLNLWTYMGIVHLWKCHPSNFFHQTVFELWWNILQLLNTDNRTKNSCVPPTHSVSHFFFQFSVKVKEKVLGYWEFPYHILSGVQTVIHILSAISNNFKRETSTEPQKNKFYFIPFSATLKKIFVWNQTMPNDCVCNTNWNFQGEKTSASMNLYNAH